MYKKQTSQLYYEKMFQEHRFQLKINVSIITYGNCRYKIKGVSVQNTKQCSLLE